MDFAIQNMGERGYHFVSIAYMYSILVCLGFIVPLENLYSYRDVTITGDGLQILTNPRHSWPLSREGSLTCHTYCHPFIMVISEDP